MSTEMYRTPMNARTKTTDEYNKNTNEKKIEYSEERCERALLFSDTKSPSYGGRNSSHNNNGLQNTTTKYYTPYKGGEASKGSLSSFRGGSAQPNTRGRSTTTNNNNNNNTSPDLDRRRQQRLKQIQYGHATDGYMNMIKLIQYDPLLQAGQILPIAPPDDSIPNKRQWDVEIRKWRRALHMFDYVYIEEEDPAWREGKEKESVFKRAQYRKVVEAQRRQWVSEAFAALPKSSRIQRPLAQLYAVRKEHRHLIPNRLPVEEDLKVILRKEEYYEDVRKVVPQGVSSLTKGSDTITPSAAGIKIHIAPSSAVLRKQKEEQQLRESAKKDFQAAHLSPSVVAPSHPQDSAHKDRSNTDNTNNHNNHHYPLPPSPEKGSPLPQRPMGLSVGSPEGLSQSRPTGHYPSPSPMNPFSMGVAPPPPPHHPHGLPLYYSPYPHPAAAGPAVYNPHPGPSTSSPSPYYYYYDPHTTVHEGSMPPYAYPTQSKSNSVNPPPPAPAAHTGKVKANNTPATVPRYITALSSHRNASSQPSVNTASDSAAPLYSKEGKRFLAKPAIKVSTTQTNNNNTISTTAASPPPPAGDSVPTEGKKYHTEEDDYEGEGEDSFLEVIKPQRALFSSEGEMGGNREAEESTR